MTGGPARRFWLRPLTPADDPRNARWETAQGFGDLTDAWNRATQAHITPKESTVSQSVRNKIYGVVATLIPVAVILGFATQDQADQALTLTDSGLALVTAVISWGTTVLAFVKSLPSKVRTVKADNPSEPA